jgi:hypothetical protein
MSLAIVRSYRSGGMAPCARKEEAPRSEDQGALGYASEREKPAKISACRHMARRGSCCGKPAAFLRGSRKQANVREQRQEVMGND